MKRFSKILSLMLTLCLVAGLVACNKDEASSGSTSAPEDGYADTGPEVWLAGGYVETDITPAGMRGGPVQVVRHDNGALDVLCAEYDVDFNVTYYRYISTDEGQSWQEHSLAWLQNFTTSDEEAATSPVYSYLNYDMLLLEDGMLLVSQESFDATSFTYSTRLILLDLQGQEQALAISLLNEIDDFESVSLTGLKRISKDKILAQLNVSYDSSDSFMSETLARVFSLSSGEELYHLSGWTGEQSYHNATTLFLEQGGEIVAYNIEDGTQADIATPSFSQMYESSFATGINTTFVDDNGVFYTASTKGVRSVRAGESVATMLMDGVNYSYGSPTSTIVAVEGTPGGGILVALQVGDDEGKILRYSYDAALEYTSNVAVYSLYDSAAVRLGLNEYAKQNPGVRVRYEYTFDRYGFVNPEMGETTVSQALAELRTRLDAGAGPDVLILDNLPYEEFIAQGLLQDISSLTGSGLLQQVTGPMYDGAALYALPTRFSLPVVVANAGDVAQYTTLDALVTAIKASDGNTIALNTLREVVQLVLQTGSGLETEEEIRAYLETVKEIVNLLGLNTIEEFESIDDAQFGHFASPEEYALGYAAVGYTQLYSFDVLLELVNSQYYQDMMVGNENGGNAPAAAMRISGAAEGVYYPTTIVGVTKSANSETAAGVVAAMLGEAVQTVDVEEGLPVLASALEGMYAAYLQKGQQYVEAGYSLVGVDTDSLLSGLATPYIVNYEWLELYFDAAKGYCEGMALEDAVARIINGK